MFSKKSLNNLNVFLPLATARRIAKIIVIDDDEQAFPYQLLQKEGFNVTYLQQIENLKDLESGEYDIIVLDIYGIAPKNVSATEGLGIIQHLKKYNPSQIIVAYSGVKYDPNQADFWKLADDYLGKPSPLITCKQKIDDLLANKFTVSYYWKFITDILSKEGVPYNKIRKLDFTIAKHISKGQKPTFDKIEGDLDITRRVALVIINIVNTILRIANESSGA